MMETIQPYRDQLMHAKKQLQDALKGGTTSHPVPVTSYQAKDVLELKENLSRVRPLWINLFYRRAQTGNFKRFDSWWSWKAEPWA